MAVLAKRVAIIVGHSKKDGGAVNSKSKISEYQFNDSLGKEILDLLSGKTNARMFYRTLSISQVVGDVSAWKADVAIELHANAADETATGSEVLFHSGRTLAKKLAGILQKKIVKALGLKDRGIKSKTSADRGDTQLRGISGAVVITEPFFIDNDSDLKIATAKMSRLAAAIADGVLEYLGVDKGLALNEVESPASIKYGERSNNVKAVQIWLNTLFGAKLATDGIAGKLTSAAHFKAVGNYLPGDPRIK